MISTIIGKYQNNKIKCTESKTKRYLHKTNHIKYITHILIEIRLKVYMYYNVSGTALFQINTRVHPSFGSCHFDGLHVVAEIW